MADDPKWPRASTLITSEQSNIGILDVPAHLTSISQTNAHLTPRAIREALQRYSTYSYTTATDLSGLRLEDLGQIADPDNNEELTQATIGAANKELTIALGGDNSITFAVALGVFGNDLATAGLITLDAHHDLRDGISNGSPVRRLIEAGLDPRRIVQIGINDFSNSYQYAKLAQELGITVITRDHLEQLGIEEACREALLVAGSAGGSIHVDLDVDVCDRSVVPACPAAAPGGISAFQLRKAARLLASNKEVRGLDITEIDASIDSADGRTVRLGALLVMEALAGFGLRA
jgi:formiminoglutamase